MNAFEVISVVGEGSYGVVYKCRCKSTGAIVAVKRFKNVDKSKYAMRAMIRELKILKMLRAKPNVAQFLRVVRDEGQVCLVMQYVEANLLNLIERYAFGVPLPQLRQLLFTLLLGLRSCHHHKIIHRDVKPENILVRKGVLSILCDFGAARTIDSPPTAMTITSDSLMNVPQEQSVPLTDYVATRWYRSPEMLLGLPNYSFASDIWAVGAIMAELALGEPIFPGNSEAEQFSLIRQYVGEFPESMMARGKPISRTWSELSRTNHRERDIGLKGDYLTHRYLWALGEKGLDLLRSFLTIDPSKRCTVDEALAHSFFDGLVLTDMPSGNPIGSSEATSASIDSVLIAEMATNSSVDVDSRNLWFGLGEGKPLRLQEIESLHNSGAVETKVPDTLPPVECGTTHAFSHTASSKRGKSGDFTADCVAGSSVTSSCVDCSQNDGAVLNAKSSTNSAVRLPSISTNLSYFYVDSSTEGHPPPSGFSSVSNVVHISPLLSNLSCPAELDTGRLTCWRLPEITKHVSLPPIFTSHNTANNNKSTGSVNFKNVSSVDRANKDPTSRIKVIRQLSVKRRGRLVFTNMSSVDSC